jgi:hypothetical protein
MERVPNLTESTKTLSPDEETKLIEAAILREVGAFPGIMLTHHWQRLHSQLRKYSVSWPEVMHRMIEEGEVKQAWKMVGAKPVPVLFLKGEVPEDRILIMQ